jgi:hypothetical protein
MYKISTQVPTRILNFIAPHSIKLLQSLNLRLDRQIGHENDRYVWGRRKQAVRFLSLIRPLVLL